MQTTFFARSFIPSLTLLFCDMHFRRRPRDYARPAASRRRPSARATRPDRPPRAWRVASSSGTPSALGEHDPARRRTRPADVDLEVLDLSKDRGASTSHGWWRHALQRDEREHDCVWLRPIAAAFDNAPVPYPRNYPWLAFTTRGGRTGAPACSRSSRCARTTRSIDR